MFRDGSVLSVLIQSVSKLLEFLNRVHCHAKYLLKIAGFWQKFEIISSITSRGDMVRTSFYWVDDLKFFNKFYALSEDRLVSHIFT